MDCTLILLRLKLIKRPSSQTQVQNIVELISQLQWTSTAAVSAEWVGRLSSVHASLQTSQASSSKERPCALQKLFTSLMAFRPFTVERFSNDDKLTLYETDQKERKITFSC